MKYAVYFSILCSLVLSVGCSVVSPGQRAVSVTLGQAANAPLGEGVYLWVPFVRGIKKINIRVQKTETKTEAASKDMQKVHTTIAINWHVNPETVVELYKKVGDEDDVVEQIINPAVSEVLKAETAKLTAEEILKNRILLKDNIDKGLTTRLSNYNIIVNDVSLTDFGFTDEFNQAVERKQIAEQEAKQAIYVTQKAEQDAAAMINRAKGQAEAQKLLQSSLTKDVLTLEYLKKWNGSLPTVLTGSGNGVMMMLNTNPNKKEQ